MRVRASQVSRWSSTRSVRQGVMFTFARERLSRARRIVCLGLESREPRKIGRESVLRWGALFRLEDQLRRHGLHRFADLHQRRAACGDDELALQLTHREVFLIADG